MGTGWRVARYPEMADPDERSTADHTHLAVRENTDDFGSLRRADLVLSYDTRTGRAATDWLARAARAYPYASMVATCTAPGRAVARYQDGRVFTLRCADCRCDPAPLVSALLVELELGAQRIDGLIVQTGAALRTVVVRQAK